LKNPNFNKSFSKFLAQNLIFTMRYEYIGWLCITFAIPND